MVAERSPAREVEVSVSRFLDPSHGQISIAGLWPPSILSVNDPEVSACAGRKSEIHNLRFRAKFRTEVVDCSNRLNAVNAAAQRLSQCNIVLRTIRSRERRKEELQFKIQRKLKRSKVSLRGDDILTCEETIWIRQLCAAAREVPVVGPIPPGQPRQTGALNRQRHIAAKRCCVFLETFEWQNSGRIGTKIIPCRKRKPTDLARCQILGWESAWSDLAEFEAECRCVCHLVQGICIRPVGSAHETFAVEEAIIDAVFRAGQVNSEVCPLRLLFGTVDLQQCSLYQQRGAGAGRLRRQTESTQTGKTQKDAQPKDGQPRSLAGDLQ